MTILEMSLTGGILIAAILLLRRCALFRLPKWTFLLLWGAALCRLLIPFSFPSPFSVYTGAERLAQAASSVQEEHFTAPVPQPESNLIEPPVIFLPLVPQEGEAAPVRPAEPEKTALPPLTALYLTGVGLCVLWFAAAYLRCLLAFRNAEPVSCPQLDHWQSAHPRPRVRLLCSGAVAAPLTYGLFRPTILFPLHMDWSDGDTLSYILAHEYVHIRRKDVFWKLLLAAALCVHWFNPAVWAMYLFANRDLELACDEAVVHSFGLSARPAYALSLIQAAESQPGFLPLCSGYKKSAAEERIRAIMKTKKCSLTAVLTGLIIIAGAVVVFATGPMSVKTEPVVLPDISQMEPAQPDKPLEKPAPAYNPALPEQTPEPEPVTEPEPIQAEPMAGLVPPENGPIQSEAEPAQPEPEETQPDPLDLMIKAHRAEWDAIEILPCPEHGDHTAPTTEIPVYSNQEMDALCRYLHEERGIRNGDMSCTTYAGIGQFVCINYTETREEEAFRRELPNGTYPVNSRGESYGSFFYRRYVGQEPDLILADASNGESGYILNHDFHFYGYPGETTSGSSLLSEEERTAFEQWLETQPSTILIPVYDLERTRIVGYFPHRNENSKDYTQTPEDIQEEKERVTEQLRRLDWSEEEIAEAIDDLSESHGW